MLKQKFKKNEKGITLIALIVTIVILLILAGISLNLVLGNNGIIEKAKEAKSETIIGEEKEAISVAYNGVQIKNLGSGVTDKELEDELHNNGYVNTTVRGTRRITVKFTDTGHAYMVDANGNITRREMTEEEADQYLVDILGDGIALTESGKVVTLVAEEEYDTIWGKVSVGEVLLDIGGIQEIYDFGNTYYIIDDSGNVYSWGSNDYGELGIGNTEYQTIPLKIEGLSDITDIYYYSGSVISKTKNGEFYAWGRNDYGELGVGSTENQTSPIKIEGLSNIVDINYYHNRVIARTENGELYAWGRNANGQLGVGSTENQTRPVKIEGLRNITKLYLYDNCAIAITVNGELYSWGYNSFGQLGVGNTTNQTSPVKIEGLSNITDIYLIKNSGSSIVAKNTNGELYSWGFNYYGDLGIGSTDNMQTSPVKIEGLTNIEDIYCSGDGSVIAKTTNGELYSWGRNTFGQLGVGSTTNQSSPVKIEGLSNITDIYWIDEDKAIAKNANGELYSWRRNAYGVLGVGNKTDQTSPVKIEGLRNITEIYNMDRYGDSLMAKNTDGELYAWGHNNGNLGIGTTTDQTSPVKIEGLRNITEIYNMDESGYSLIAKNIEGKLYAWGNNSYGRLGIGNTEYQLLSPVCFGDIENLGFDGEAEVDKSYPSDYYYDDYYGENCYSVNRYITSNGKCYINTRIEVVPHEE